MATLMARRCHTQRHRIARPIAHTQTASIRSAQQLRKWKFHLCAMVSCSMLNLFLQLDASCTALYPAAAHVLSGRFACATGMPASTCDTQESMGSQESYAPDSMPVISLQVGLQLR